MAERRSTSRVPIWVRVPATIVLVLVLVAVGPMILDAAGVAGGHGAGDEMEMDHRDHDRGADTDRDGDHGADDDHGPRDRTRRGAGHGPDDGGHGPDHELDRDDTDHGSRDGPDGRDHDPGDDGNHGSGDETPVHH